jgi:hypothetical protein
VKLLSLALAIQASQAQTIPTTPNIGLQLPAHGTYNWDTYYNNNWNLLDSRLSEALNAANYSSINAAVTAACASLFPKTVLIPASIPITQTYTNGCNAPLVDYRLGTQASPTSTKTFQTPNLNLFAWDSSPVSNDPLAHGDNRLAAVEKIITTGSGGESIIPLYTESNYYAGFTGGAYGGMTVVQAFNGSHPNVVAHNLVWTDSAYMPISTCARGANVTTCFMNMTVGQNAQTVTVPNPYKVGDFIYISGYSDASINTGAFGWTITAIGSNSISFANTGPDTSGGSGGVIAHPHQTFGFELDQFNNAHDPTVLTPTVAQNNIPVWGITNSSVGTFPLTAGFFASGPMYEAFLGQDAKDSIFTAGYPIVSGSALTATAAFRARPRRVATAGNNSASLPSCWDNSTWNGTAFSEFSYCVAFTPLSATVTNTDATLQFYQSGWQTTPINFYKQGHITVDSGSSAAVGYGFNGWTNGIYNASGITTNAGAFNATGGYQYNGTAGFSGTKTAGTCVFTIAGGIITNVTGC